MFGANAEQVWSKPFIHAEQTWSKNIMSILDLISSATGFTYRKKATTRGGEYSGPCPFCSDSGNDRFSIHPEQDHFVCRQCRKAGDSITFMMQYHGMTYRAACTELNIIPKYTDRLLDAANEKPG